MPRRGRPPKLASVLSGLNSELWRRDSERLSWAQQDLRFREIVAVLINERIVALAPNIPMTENRLLGRAEGYQLALDVLQSLAQGIERQPDIGEPTYEPVDGGQLNPAIHI